MAIQDLDQVNTASRNQMQLQVLADAAENQVSIDHKKNQQDCRENCGPAEVGNPAVPDS
jgi:hypothetical protein